MCQLWGFCLFFQKKKEDLKHIYFSWAINDVQYVHVWKGMELVLLEAMLRYMEDRVVIWGRQYSFTKYNYHYSYFSSLSKWLLFQPMSSIFLIILFIYYYLYYYYYYSILSSIPLRWWGVRISLCCVYLLAGLSHDRGTSPSSWALRAIKMSTC